MTAHGGDGDVGFCDSRVVEDIDVGAVATDGERAGCSVDYLAYLAAAVDDGEFLVGIDGRVAVSGEVFAAAEDASLAQRAVEGAGEVDDLVGRGSVAAAFQRVVVVVKVASGTVAPTGDKKKVPSLVVSLIVRFWAPSMVELKRRAETAAPRALMIVSPVSITGPKNSIPPAPVIVAFVLINPAAGVPSCSAPSTLKFALTLTIGVLVTRPPVAIVVGAI